MDSLSSFLANVVVLEGDAAPHYQAFSEVALAAGDVELEAFFSSLAELTRMDTREARAGAPSGKATVVLRRPMVCISRPSSAIRAGSPALLDLHRAMAQALELKRRSHGYYASVALLATDPGLHQTASAFEAEAASHLAVLEDWIVRLTA